MPHHLLIVDDEEGVLDMLNNLFRRQGYEVSLASSGQQALGILQNTQMDLILADNMMPDMSGVELLKEAQTLCPEAIRILLTAYGSLPVAMAAINEANVYHFVTKPWNNRDLLLTIRRALEHHDLIVQQRIFVDTLELMAEDHTREISDLRQTLREMSEKIQTLVS